MGQVMNEVILENAAKSRVAQVFLRHGEPKTRDAALQLLMHRMGVYVLDKSTLGQEVERYFA